MIAAPRRADSRRRLAATAAVQVALGVVLLVAGLSRLLDGDREQAERSAVRIAEAIAATLGVEDFADDASLRRRLSGLASELAASILVARDGVVTLHLGPTGRPSTIERSEREIAIRLDGTSAGGSEATPTPAGGWQVSAAVPAVPGASIGLRLPSGSGSGSGGAMLAVGGVLLLLLMPATLLAWRGRLRRDRLEDLAAEVEHLAEAAAVRTPDPILSDPDEELLPIADAIHHLSSAWLDRVTRLESRLEETGGLLEALGSALITLDRQHRVRSLNAAAADLLGIDRQTATGRLLHELVRSPQLHRLLSRSLSGGDARPEEFPLSVAGGEIVVQATCSRVADRGGDRGGLLLLMTDVTRIRRLESLRSDFAANVSHELRTPITNIKGYADTLVEVGFDDPEQSRNFLEIVRRNADRLAAIIEDLLTLAQLEGPDARQRLAPSPCNAARLAGSVAESLGPAASARGISIDTTRVPSIEFVANGALLEQALANLVSNAIKYAPDDSTVHLGARADDDLVVLSVRDEGPGIPPEHLERLFERFYRIDRARSRDRGGTGLGLSIVKHIAAVHDGRVEVDSEVGRGSEFRLILPREPRPGDPEPSAEATPRESASQGDASTSIRPPGPPSPSAASDDARRESMRGSGLGNAASIDRSRGLAPGNPA